VTLQAGEWLPDDAFTEEAVRLALAEQVSGWSNRWFARAQTEISAVRMSAGKSRLAQSLLVRGVTTEADLSGRGKRTLLEGALGVDLSELTLTESDHKVLDAFATEAVKDMLSALDRMGEGKSGGAMLSVSLSLEGKEMVVVTLSCQVLIPAMKAASGGVCHSDKALRSRTEGLKQVELIVEGFLGQAELTLDDLKGLALGDVVVLDSSLKSPIELRLHSSKQCVGRGRLVRTNNRVSIQF